MVADEDAVLSVGSFFSGIGLLDYGLCLAGIEHRWFCESDEWRRSILATRWPGIPVHSDVRDANAGWGRVDMVAGGFPCKGASTAGKREGFGHPETVLWREMRRAVGELRPRYVLVENVANILGLHGGRVWGEVLGDLAAFGYDTVWDCLPAAAVGAPHRRDRVFAVATDTDQRSRGAWTGRGSPLGQSPGAGYGDDPWGSREPTTDPMLTGLEGRGLQGPTSHRVAAAAHTSWDAEGRPGPQAGTNGERARQGAYVAPDPGERGQPQQPPEHGGESAGPDADVERRGVRVEWGAYDQAIRRWEQVGGPAPEPLIPRVDARDAARVERSRLSALGDGVQVQVGYLAGCYIRELEEGRLAA